MHGPTFDALTRHAGQDRRSSLKALGAVALMTAVPTAVVAGKAGKKAKKKCKKQVGPCRQAFEPLCSGSMSPEACRQQAAECCAFLKTCKSGPALECFITNFIE